MAWLLLLLSLIAFVVAFISTSIALSVFCLLAALILLVLGVLGVLVQRVGKQPHNGLAPLGPTASHGPADHATKASVPGGRPGGGSA